VIIPELRKMGDRWRADPAAFIEEALIDPETNRPFVLTDAQRRFLARAFELTPDGRLRYPELLFSGPKKIGKTAFAAMLTLYVVLVLGGRFAEAYLLANDLEQSTGRVFQAIKRIVAASPLLASDAIVTKEKIEFPSSGATITALASDFAGAAGANPTISVFDELWAYTSERSHRLWDEMVPPPTRKIACRLTVTYAGFSGESKLLEGLYNRGLTAEQIAPDLYAADGQLTYWSHQFSAPWQTEGWREQMRRQLRPNGYLRLIENQWVTSERRFVEPEWWEACVDPEARPVLSDPHLVVHAAVDASTKRDSTAIAVVSFDNATKRVRLIWHRIFQPTPAEPLDFEATVEATLLELRQRFRVQSIRYDPYQLASTAQRLQRRGLPMWEFPQTTGNLTEASSNLYELIRGHNLAAYPDPDIALAIRRAVALETPRGWRITKEKASHKIDVVVALAMAALDAVHSGQSAAAQVAVPIVVTSPRGFSEFASETDTWAAYQASRRL
jgi:phage terminase large subunit-like protein